MEIINAIWNYIQTNSIDFIAIIASIIIAIQTDKWIDNQKDKEQKKRILMELPEEMNQLAESLKLEETNIDNNMRHDKLTLNLYPYETPLWDSIKSTEKINIFSDCNYIILSFICVLESNLGLYVSAESIFMSEKTR